jgi:putative transposase
MPNYKRHYFPGYKYFFTVVTHNRKPLFLNPSNRKLLRATIIKTKQRHPFKIDAWVLLPDHMHCIWTLPEDDMDYSKRWRLIKCSFTKNYLKNHNVAINLPKSKILRHEHNVWQSRFWEHQIRNEKDFNNHLNYIFYNPVKHGWVEDIKDWPYSSFHKIYQTGFKLCDYGDIKKFNIKD